MSKYKVFISKLPPPQGLEKATFYSYDGNEMLVHDTISDIGLSKIAIVSFDWDAVVTWLSIRNEKLPRGIIDIEQIAKQLHGHKRLPGETSPWSIWTLIRTFYDDNNENFVKTQKIYQQLLKVENEEEKELYFRFLKSMFVLVTDLVDKLKDLGEYERYNSVERRIRIINLHRTYYGISIDTEEISNWIEELSEKVYKFRNQLQLQYSIVSIKDLNTIKDRINSELKFFDSEKLIEEKGYYFFLKDTKRRHPFIQLLYDERKSNTDLQTLLAIGALKPRSKKIYPIFDSFGTVTARTKMVSPNLQNLSKKFRSIISADEGKKLLYIDYSQFEAGILADDSEDDLLIDEFNNKYIYDEIAKRISISRFISDKDDQLVFCKSLFYKFSYGMDIKNHSQILKDFNLSDYELVLSPLIIHAFEAYSKLNEYRQRIKLELADKGKIGTRIGNFRYQFENEKRDSWAISQRIQGTASLILKRSIITLWEKDKEIEFLIPMHDAALFQVPIEKVIEKKNIIKSIFENEFNKECPSIKGKAMFKNFSIGE